MFQSKIQINYETVTGLLADLVKDVPEDQKTAFIVRLRGTWLLEKVSRNNRLFREYRAERLA